MHKKRIKAVLFDLDGTLSDSMGFHDTAWTKAFQDFGVIGTEGQAYLHEGKKQEEYASLIYHQCTGKDATPDLASQLVKRKEKYFGELFEIRLFPGTLELLDELHARDVECALVTGSSDVRSRFASCGTFLEHFDHIITSEDVKRGKPHPEPYLKAAEAIGADPSECLVIENAPLGVISAREAHMRCIAVINNSPLKPEVLLREKAEVVLPDLEAVKMWVEENV